MLSKKTITVLSLFLVFNLSSCSTFLESTRTLVGEGPDQAQGKSHAEAKWVSSKKYDDLQREYERLAQAYDQLKNQTAGEPQAPVAETVDVFAQNGLADKAAVSQTVALEPVKASNAQEEIELFKKGKTLLANGNQSESLRIFQYLEQSQTEQVRVQAKTELGTIYLSQEQFDLALQVFDSIIRQDAFSSQTLIALEKALLCCEKLGLEQKRVKYQSILKDFFEINV